MESVDDIHFLPARSNEIVDAIRQVRATFADRIGPARATGDGPWGVEAWAVGDGSLVRHDLATGVGWGRRPPPGRSGTRPA